MRSLLEIRLGRWSMLLLTVVSAAATVLIITGGHDRTPAQMAALAALRERPAATTPAAAAGAGAATSTRSASAPAPRPTHAAASTPSPSAASGSSTPATSTVAAQTTTPASRASSATTPSTTHHPASSAAKLPTVGHVFELVVSARAGASAFGARTALPYLRTLARRGTLLSGYRSLGDGALADELALVSGQAPNADTARQCPRYVDFPTHAAPNGAGILHGRGCVYPDSVLTIGDQVTAAGKTWHAYVDDMGKESCVHPNSDAVDDTTLPFAQPGYDTRHNPFIYFHSLLDLGDCASDDVDLGHLPAALRSAHTTPEFSYVAPGACADADPTMVPASPATSGTSTSTSTTTTPATATPTSTTTTPATTSTTPATTTPPGSAATSTSPAGCPSGTPSGTAAENTFLRTWVRRILASAAYRRDGMLVIAVTRDGRSHGSASRTQALVLSRWTRHGGHVSAAIGPYSLLRLQEDALGLKHLAHAATAPSIASQVLVSADS